MQSPLGEHDLVLCSGTIGRAPLDVAVRAAAGAGFRGLSVYYADYRAARGAGWSDADLARCSTTTASRSPSSMAA